MARANIRYGFLLRSIAIGRAEKSSAKIIADALVVRAADAYFGLARNVICPAPASSIPATPVISRSGEPFSRRELRVEAMSASFIVNPHNVRNGDCSGSGPADRHPSYSSFLTPTALLWDDSPHKRSKGGTMPHYLSQVAYSRQGWQALLASPQDRIEALRPAGEKSGRKVKSAWFALAEYYVTLILDMPDSVIPAANA